MIILYSPANIIFITIIIIIITISPAPARKRFPGERGLVAQAKEPRI